MGKQALIVSENSEIPVVLGAVVGGEWHLRTAATGRQALDALGELGESLAPDLILLDYDLSDMDGLSFLKSAEARLGGIPPTVLCASSPLDEAGQARAEEFGLLDILQKPVSHGDLEMAL